MEGATPADFDTAFECVAYSAQSNSSKLGDAESAWGTSAFTMNGKAVVVRSFALADQPRFLIVSVDGQYNTPLGRSITDWMILKSGHRQQEASHKRPAHLPKPTATLYAASLYGIDADPDRLTNALHQTITALGWTPGDETSTDTDGVTIARHTFTDAAGRPVIISTYAPRYRPTLVEVAYATPDPNDSLNIFNGLSDRLGLPKRTPPGQSRGANADAVRD